MSGVQTYFLGCAVFRTQRVMFPMTNAVTETMSNSVPHSLYEDILAIMLGAGLCALGIEFLTDAGLIIGQTAGLGVMISYLSGYSFGLVFFIINIPFYALAFFGVGLVFTVKTFVAIALLSVLTETIPLFLSISNVHPMFAAIFGGALIGLGVMSLFRHGASLGGIGILAYFLQEKMGVRAGWAQLGFDAVLFALALLVLRVDVVIYSLMGAVVCNMLVGINHRADRYLGR